jgi:hypothetical protein
MKASRLLTGFDIDPEQIAERLERAAEDIREGGGVTEFHHSVHIDKPDAPVHEVLCVDFSVPIYD